MAFLTKNHEPFTVIRPQQLPNVMGAMCFRFYSLTNISASVISAIKIESKFPFPKQKKTPNFHCCAFNSHILFSLGNFKYRFMVQFIWFSSKIKTLLYNKLRIVNLVPMCDDHKVWVCVGHINRKAKATRETASFLFFFFLLLVVTEWNCIPLWWIN